MEGKVTLQPLHRVPVIEKGVCPSPCPTQDACVEAIVQRRWQTGGASSVKLHRQSTKEGREECQEEVEQEDEAEKLKISQDGSAAVAANEFERVCCHGGKEVAGVGGSVSEMRKTRLCPD